MNKITGEYPARIPLGGKNMFWLQPDKSINPYTWCAPIVWTGQVDGFPVRFVQIESGGSLRSDFDWSGFPIDLEGAIDYIIEAIDNKLREMD